MRFKKKFCLFFILSVRLCSLRWCKLFSHPILCWLSVSCSASALSSLSFCYSPYARSSNKTDVDSIESTVLYCWLRRFYCWFIFRCARINTKMQVGDLDEFDCAYKTIAVKNDFPLNLIQQFLPVKLTKSKKKNSKTFHTQVHNLESLSSAHV